MKPGSRRKDIHRRRQTPTHGLCVENGINTVHLSYVREGVGHALIGFRQWIPDEHITDPVTSLRMALPLELTFRTKGRLAIDITATVAADGFRPDFYCGDEVYGNCPELRAHFEANKQAYVLRVQKNFRITLPNGAVLSCDQAVKTLLQGLKHKRRWEIRSAGKGSKGDRWYAWAWIATASPRHCLLIRKHLRTNELAFHYCFVSEAHLLTKARHPLGELAPPASSTLTLVTQTHQTRPQHRKHPGQLANGGCGNRRLDADKTAQRWTRLDSGRRCAWPGRGRR
jgi:hypothetical protein